MDKQKIQEEYEKNPGFKKWFDAYRAHTNIADDFLMTDPIVIHSAEFWREQREKEAKE